MSLQLPTTEELLLASKVNINLDEVCREYFYNEIAIESIYKTYSYFTSEIDFSTEPMIIIRYIESECNHYRVDFSKTVIASRHISLNTLVDFVKERNNI